MARSGTGKVRIKVDGRGDRLDQALPSPFAPGLQMFEAGSGVVYQLVNDRGPDGRCWETWFITDREIVENSATRFKGR